MKRGELIRDVSVKCNARFVAVFRVQVPSGLPHTTGLKPWPPPKGHPDDEVEPSPHHVENGC